VLLKTIGKLIKKMISNHLQLDMIKFDLVHPNQVGGVCQRSTEDAGLFLTHLVCTGWAKGKKTSVVAFDIAQFFSSLNHAMLLAILWKQGFLSVVTKFFASYLVDRFTAYMWGLFCSGPCQADIGVGQGSALLPVLSALYIAPVMKLYHMNPVSLKISLLSFVDDGTVAAQSKSLHENIETLKEAYTLLLSLFVTLGLVLEHSKTEYFIFDQSYSDYSPPLDLGYAPYTGDNPLKPNLYWRYLGFYFDRKLLFHEHVRFYSTKALSSVKAMKMLGSSTRGLPPREKRLLYRSCVLPIATYGYWLWFFDGTQCKKALSSLKTMQRKAAIWITGAFSTSPTGGVESLAGLIPVHLHLQKMAGRANYRAATISDSHPLWSILGPDHHRGAQAHPCAISKMSEAFKQKVKGTVMEIDRRLPDLTESFEPCAPEARPGARLMDRFSAQIDFDDCGHLEDDEALQACKNTLNDLLKEAKRDNSAVYCSMDASLPDNT